MQRLLRGVDPLVFWGSAGLIFAFVLWGLLGPESLGTVMGDVLGWVIRNFGWSFILIATGALALCVFLVLHPWGSIRLGPDDSRPSFATPSWIAMMFAAGLGAGLLFYGTAEPISHWSAPPHGLAEPRSEEAAGVALQYTYFHWGFNGWALYQVLRDPELLFGSQNVVMTVSADKLERVGRDKFLQVVNAVNRRLTENAIVEMNAAVTNGQDDRDAAARFLRQTGLLRPVGSEGG